MSSDVRQIAAMRGGHTASRLTANPPEISVQGRNWSSPHRWGHTLSRDASIGPAAPIWKSMYRSSTHRTLLVHVHGPLVKAVLQMRVIARRRYLALEEI